MYNHIPISINMIIIRSVFFISKRQLILLNRGMSVD